MELKPNTYYRTRDGRKAFYHGPDPFRSGWGVVSFGGGCYRVTVTGSYTPSIGEQASDLIDEWREPRTASCKKEFVLVECDNNPGVQVRIEGSECSKCRIIGRKTVEVSITEGDGL